MMNSLVPYHRMYGLEPSYSFTPVQLTGQDLKVQEEWQGLRSLSSDHESVACTLAQGAVQKLLASPQERFARFDIDTDAAKSEPGFFFNRNVMHVRIRTRGYIEVG